MFDISHWLVQILVIVVETERSIKLNKNITSDIILLYLQLCKIYNKKHANTEKGLRLESQFYLKCLILAHKWI
jgi:hypothetical protein